jgi:GNAT superfamily N-acetyltransferase
VAAVLVVVMSTLSPLPMNLNQFLEWYRELGKLKIFWAKPLHGIKLLSIEDEGCLLEVEWFKRNRVEKAVMCIARTLDKVFEMVTTVERAYSTNLILVPEDSEVDLAGMVDAKSILYFWDVYTKTLEPNEQVRTTVASEWDVEDVKVFREIHRNSWGYFIPPRENDHLVILAWLDEEPAGMAYLNKHNFNIDYGIHVKRDFWRKRIGTKILKEALRTSGELGAKHISVVRVLRSLKNSSSDRRALSFYRANNPSLKCNVFRVHV